VNATPRSIREIRAEYLIKLSIERDGDGIYARHLERVHLVDLIRESKARASQSDGLADLGTPPEGDRYPDRAKVSGWVVIRNPKVRDFVIKSAKGQCEYCGKRGFQVTSGAFYLEAHHIISLANQGPDTVDNVIALCPEHHREAHYGQNAHELELEFLKRIEIRNTK
jgi:5-methylcytosine-specific restriction protein A